MGASIGAALSSVATAAWSAPQLTTDVTVGIARNGATSEVKSSIGFLGGLRGELLFAREKDSDFGVGPYVEALTTTGFSNAQIGGGASLLVPIHPYLPAVISLGGYWGSDASGSHLGLSGELFWGTHGFNYHAFYALSAGIFVGGRYPLDEPRSLAAVAGIRVDLEVLALPFLLAFEAARGAHASR